MAVDANTEYEKQHLNNLHTYQKEVEQEYLSTIDTIFQYVALTTFANEVFKLSNYPVLKARIEEELLRFRDRMYGIITRSIRKEWALSEAKNEAVLKEAYGEVSERVLEQMKNKPEAIEEFINLKTRRIPLSERVWKLHGQFYEEIEKELYAGISEGKSAKKMAAEMKHFLQEPDKLFRRVKDAKGRLSLSGPARKYRPGAGVYRSSFKNALRLTAHETNRAYRTADHERWTNTKFILGVEVKLSNSHPKYDMCDRLVGIFPPNYKHTGFHIRCLCYSVPLLPTLEQYKEYENAILAGTDANFKFDKVKDIHPRAKQWIVDNAERIEGWKSKPLFIQDNPRYFKAVLAE